MRTTNGDRPGILGRKRLEFRDHAELARYYEAKYRDGGYRAEGCTIRGIDVSQLYHQARHASALRHLEARPHDVILDAGCGDGSLSARLAAVPCVVHAVDVADNAIAPAVRSMAAVHFRAMNAEQLDYPDAMFDRVVCVEALEHMLEPQRALREFARTLRPGGRLVLTYPTVNRTAVKAFQSRLGIHQHLEISEHLTEWSYDELVEQARAAGFIWLALDGIAFDFGVLGRVKYLSSFLSRGLTTLALSLRRFPRNSSFVSIAFQRSRG